MITDYIIYILFLLSIILIPLSVAGQEQQDAEADSIATNGISLFLDCRGWGCNERYVRSKIAFVNFVRDKTAADIHLLITRQSTGSGGSEFLLNFIGMRQFANLDYQLRYISFQSDTEEQERTGLVKFIKTGLLRYLPEVNNLQNFQIIYDPGEEAPIQLTAEEDEWDNWIFEIGANGSFNGEASEEEYEVSGGLSARRITTAWKIELDYRQEYQSQRFEDEGETDVFITQSQDFDGLIAKSLTPHWSLGMFSEVRSATRDNLNLRVGATPVIEYNIFPYTEYAEREISFRYGILNVYNDYNELTIFNKTEAYLLQQRLDVNMEFVQPWGAIEGRIEAYSYLHDPEKSHLTFDLEFDIRLTRGLAMNVSGRYSFINDQLSIPRGDLTREEQLLDLRERATDYSFGIWFGFEYTFGSIYNNVVNPRF